MSVPTVSLMDAVTPKPGHITWSASNCVQEIIFNATATLGLTSEEVATIKAYTANCLYFTLNSALRTEKYFSIEPWFPYLKLFQLALTKLNATEGTFCRGESRKWSWAVTSLSSDLSACVRFLSGPTHSPSGTLYTIHSHTARSVQNISKYSEEAESILLPATSFKVITHGVHPLWSDTYTIELEEIRSATTDTSTTTNVVLAVFTKHITTPVIDATSGHSHLILPVSKTIGNN
ncbi:unnamed protein product, partial [Adineta ricciae]